MLFLFIFIFCFSVPDVSSMNYDAFCDSLRSCFEGILFKKPHKYSGATINPTNDIPEPKYNSFLLNKTISASLTEMEDMVTTNEIDNTINLQILCKKQLLLALYYALHIRLELSSNFTSWISGFDEPFEKFAFDIINMEESSQDTILKSLFSIYCFLSDLIPHPYDENNETREETISFLNMLMEEHLENQLPNSYQNQSSFFPQYLATPTNIKKLIIINITLFKESTFFYSLFRESMQAIKSLNEKQFVLKRLYSRAQLAEIERYIYSIKSE